MARAQLSQQKRARERAKQEKRQLKAERRQSAKNDKQTKPATGTEEDPDIAGIVPGPQPSPWDDAE
jgi:hypothetical protein